MDYNVLRIPENRVSVKICSWVKPEIELLFPVTFALAEHIVTVPAELPGTSLSCISILPYKYSCLDWNPEPENLSSERVRRLLLLSILARPSPHVISKSWLKLPAEVRTT
ncbi:hypothetical protein Lal_00049577 [Lupinus albus]|nr:hypothetical protein Lal_00049577 [Lupinus albus]